jgi:biopolymer transport protein ExbD
MRRSYTDVEYRPVEINVIPLIDVMFFLVLFFVATASFVRETGVDVNRPTAQTAVQQAKANIMITVTRNGEIWIERRKVDVRSVRANVERLLVENADSTVIIVADSETPTGLLVQALDQARLAGAPNVAIAASETHAQQ